MKKRSTFDISDEMLATFLDGNVDSQESQTILKAYAEDAKIREILNIAYEVDAELGRQYSACEILPMTALAASCGEENYCCLECEKYILNEQGIEFDERKLLDDAINNGWQKEDGTALHNIGRHLEGKGLVVKRQYRRSIDDIIKALENREHIIAAVDGGELLGDKVAEALEDIMIGEIPDHTVVVLACDKKRNIVTIFDPNSPNKEDSYTIDQFMDAWNDSKNYLVTVTQKDNDVYIPEPIDLSDVELSSDLNELREAIAENAHNVWAKGRQELGWTYGERRDDEKKQTPCMVPYSKLPDSEKKFDRDMAMQTLKLVQKLGYDIVKRKSSKPKKKTEDKFYCNNCGHPVAKFQVYCDGCGKLTEIDWSLHKS